MLISDGVVARTHATQERGARHLARTHKEYAK